MAAIMAFDLGTTHLKWVLVDESGTPLEGRQTDIGPSGTDSVSEQDPERILQALLDALGDAVQHSRIGRVSFSSAMHTFIAASPDGRALTKSWTWMDKRSRGTAEQLSQSPLASTLKRLTGMPVHTMSPLVKWLSVKNRLPAGSRPVALKDYILYHLTGQWVTDYSTAAASGMLGLDNQWCPEALNLANLSVPELPQLSAMDQRIPALRKPWDVVIGGSDGATAHRHLEIPCDGAVAVLAMGTSGALRTTTKDPVNHPELFCYAMGPMEGYLTGSAFSNVGNLLNWIAHLFGADIDTMVDEALLAARSQRPLPLALPYWFGERSPWWRDDLRGAWLNLEPQHGRADLAGAVLLSMAAAYWHGLDTLRRAGAPVREIRGGSGLLDTQNMAQWMADALGQDIVLHDDRDASLWGAVDLAGGRLEHQSSRSIRCYPRDAALHARVKDTWQRVQDWVRRVSPPTPPPTA